ncbi:cytochrome c-type biogenesis protein [Allopusillimonas ginsengisoli]|uniref:cytochrome c-type biogenesis protein n=1 Tax=Allopusillimonas ginsengisoli TaxID=453575 RepID=UPI001020B3D7|nr:cytochrome c-type biogenesis protein [Allopusillimonas ginsengisoli]TEA78984.1 cytochrome c-type biogenesis protein CcmH [Allopusillimonas ginsengisoli]
MTRTAIWLMLSLALFVGLSAALAREARPLVDDPALEARVMELADDLRCLVCQNETLAASHAELAIDLRNQIRERLAAGDSREHVIDFLVARYGDFILYRPPFQPNTWALWVGPFVLLILALWVMARVIWQRRAIDSEVRLLSEKEELP